MPAGGGALTLYEEANPEQSNNNHNVHIRFLKSLQTLLPEGCHPIVNTDAGFCNPWLKAVRALGWDYVDRVRNRDP